MENRLQPRNRHHGPLNDYAKINGHSTGCRKLRYPSKSEKPDVIYADLNSEIVDDENNIPPRSTEFQQKHRVDGKGKQNEELIRYMSSLPSFLEKGENLRERAFNVGVLDWRLLEKWQHYHHTGNRHSSCSSYTSSFSSTEGSSSHSSRGRSQSPAWQKMHRPTLQSHFYGPSSESYSESSEENDLKFHDSKAVPSGSCSVQQNTLGAHLLFDGKAEHTHEDCMGKDADRPKTSMARRSQSLEDIRAKIKIQGCDSLKRHSKLQTSFDVVTDQRYNSKQKMRDDEQESRHFLICKPLVSTDKRILQSEKAGHLNSSNADYSEAPSTELYSHVPHSYNHRDADPSHSQIEESCSVASNHNTFSNKLCHRIPDNGNISVNSSGCKKLQDSTSITELKDYTLVKPSELSSSKSGTAEASKVRNPSPTRRFSFSLGKLGRNSASSVTSTVSQSSSKNLENTSGAEGAGVSSSTLNNSKENGKGRSSPLRRLLEPLMKPARASVSDSKSSDIAYKSSGGHGESAALHSMKVKLDLRTCKKIDAEVPHCSRKNGSSTEQALLQVTVKNGFPLFTFAVDNKNEILAATMRNLSSEKDEVVSLYSFFSINEMKKKSGSWIYQGKKERGNGIIPNIVAQMRVTDASVKQNSLDQSTSKECVLFSYDSKQADQLTSDLQLNNELAAVVVRISSNSKRLKEPLQDLKFSSGTGTMEENQSNVRNDDQISMTVILPGGNHGLPIKGEPSSLIRRWKSGGSCDCGGWDLGCRLRVLTNHTLPSHRSSLAKLQHTPQLFELFSQGEELDQKPVFSLSSFKDRVYSVEFNSSIEILQAFSISISILSCLKPSEFLETSTEFDEKPSEDITATETNSEKVCSRSQMEFPAYVSYPPLSPVGRV